MKRVFIVIMVLSFMISCKSTQSTSQAEQAVQKSVNEQFIEASNDKRKIRLQDLQIAEYKHLDELHEARHKMYKDELKDAKNELKWYEIKTNFGYIMSFAAGAVITGFIAKEVLD